MSVIDHKHIFKAINFEVPALLRRVVWHSFATRRVEQIWTNSQQKLPQALTVMHSMSFLPFCLQSSDIELPRSLSNVYWPLGSCWDSRTESGVRFHEIFPNHQPWWKRSTPLWAEGLTCFELYGQKCPGKGPEDVWRLGRYHGELLWTVELKST